MAAPDAVSQQLNTSLVPSFGVLCLLVFCFVMFSQKLPLGEAAGIGAILAAAFGKHKFNIPSFYRWYLAYLAIGALGLFASAYPDVVGEELIQVAKFSILGIAACNILVTARDCRAFVFGYLALFALFPVRGALYNYVNGYTEAGRIAWNFFFRNPNDLAMACFLPLGLCAYLICTEKNPWIKRAAWIGLVTLPGVQMLTQSRGAMLAFGAGVIYFVLHVKHRMRALLCIAALLAMAVIATPGGVWQRVAGLSRLSSGDLVQVDPEKSASGRFTLMGVALGIVNDNPLLGIGFGAYPYENAKRTQNDATIGRDERGMRDAHSTYLRSAAETGWFGGLCVVLYMFTAIVYCHRSRRKILRQNGDPRLAMAVLALEACMIAYSLGCIFNSAERSTFFMWQFTIPYLLAAMLVKILTQAVPTPTPVSRTGTIFARLGVGRR